MFARGFSPLLRAFAAWRESPFLGERFPTAAPTTGRKPLATDREQTSSALCMMRGMQRRKLTVLMCGLAAAGSLTSLRAGTNGFIVPFFRGSPGAQSGYWEIFSVPSGEPGNMPDRPGSNMDAVLTQTDPGGFLTGSGNIYNPGGISAFTLVHATTTPLGTVVLQVRTLGSELDYGSVLLTLTINRGGLFAYDPTQDGVLTYLSTNDPGRVEDLDAGRPIELFGVGYRNGYDAATFDQCAPLGSPSPGERNAHAVGMGTGGAWIDVSNNVGKTNEAFPDFEVAPFAIGQTEQAAAGQPVPTGARVTFDLDLANPFVRAYVQEALDAGHVRFMITSLHESGGQFGAPSYPDFATRFNEAVFEPTRLEVEGRVLSDTDLDGDGLPDDWEVQFLHTLAATGAVDSDGDGSLNQDELNAGTDPLDGGSVFRVLSIERHGEGMTELSFQPAAGGVTVIEFTEDGLDLIDAFAGQALGARAEQFALGRAEEKLRGQLDGLGLEPDRLGRSEDRRPAQRVHQRQRRHAQPFHRRHGRGGFLALDHAAHHGMKVVRLIGEVALQKPRRVFHGDEGVPHAFLAASGERGRPLAIESEGPILQRHPHRPVLHRRGSCQVQAELEGAGMKAARPVERVAALEVVPFDAEAQFPHIAEEGTPAIADGSPGRGFRKQRRPMARCGGAAGGNHAARC